MISKREKAQGVCTLIEYAQLSIKRCAAVITAQAQLLPLPHPHLSSVVPQPLQLPANEPEASVMRLLHHLMCWNSLGGRGDGWGEEGGGKGAWLAHLLATSESARRIILSSLEQSVRRE